MASTGVNVLRWSALGFGVIYGVYRQASISARDRFNAQKAEYTHKEDLISQAKAEFQRTTAPPPQSNKGSDDTKDDSDTLPWLQESK